MAKEWKDRKRFKFESLGFNNELIETIGEIAHVNKYGTIPVKSLKSNYEDLRLMNKRMLIQFIQKVRNSESYNNVKANRYSPEEQREVSRMSYAQSLLRTNRVA